MPTTPTLEMICKNHGALDMADLPQMMAKDAGERQNNPNVISTLMVTKAARKN